MANACGVPRWVVCRRTVLPLLVLLTSGGMSANHGPSMPLICSTRVPGRSPCCHAALPGSTPCTTGGISFTPFMYAATKHTAASSTFITTPAEMMIIRCHTGRFLKLRGSVSSSTSSAGASGSTSPVPSPAMATYPPSGIMPSL
jgi:hypothetical protein